MTFQQAVIKTFDVESHGSTPELKAEAHTHIAESIELRKHIRRMVEQIAKAREVGFHNEDALLAATLNAAFEFGYRTHRYEGDGDAN